MSARTKRTARIPQEKRTAQEKKSLTETAETTKQDDLQDCQSPQMTADAEHQHLPFPPTDETQVVDTSHPVSPTPFECQKQSFRLEFQMRIQSTCLLAQCLLEMNSLRVTPKQLAASKTFH